MVDYGSSPVLDQDFDFILDETGDIQCTNQTGSEIDELEKDLSYAIASGLEDEVGSPITPTQQALVRTQVTDIVYRDPRIEKILNIIIEESQDTPSGDGFNVLLDLDIINVTLDEPLIIQI